MLRVLDCLTAAHDYRLTLLAGWLALISAVAAFRLYGRLSHPGPSAACTSPRWVRLS